MNEQIRATVTALTNNAENSKAAFLKLRAGKKLTEGERNQVVGFYLETLAQMERLATAANL